MSEYSCPHCHRPTYDDEALLCHFCGESLQRPGSGLLSNMKYGHKTWVVALVLSAIGAFLLIQLF